MRMNDSKKVGCKNVVKLSSQHLPHKHKAMSFSQKVTFPYNFEAVILTLYCIQDPFGNKLQ